MREREREVAGQPMLKVVGVPLLPRKYVFFVFFFFFMFVLFDFDVDDVLDVE